MASSEYSQSRLLAAALHHEAKRAGRSALADRIQADFLTSIDYRTDRIEPRVRLSDSLVDDALQEVLLNSHVDQLGLQSNGGLAGNLLAASQTLQQLLRSDLADDPFKRLGMWTDFLTNKVYMAVFVHPNPGSAYRVFEVINTRGRELTTADLLKSYVLSQTIESERADQYERWQSIARALQQGGPGTLVQYIRHVVTLQAGHVLPRDLFAFLADRGQRSRDRRRPPSVPQLMDELERRLPLYLQMIDPTVGGPADDDWLGVFSALRDLNIIVVRPLLLAIADSPLANVGMRRVLELVVRRIVVGNLGTGNVERRLSEAARRVEEDKAWESALNALDDLNPTVPEFSEQLRKRSFNKGTLTFLRRSIVERSVGPDTAGYLHFVRPRQVFDWSEFPDDEFTYWGSTIGNTVLAGVERRPKGSNTFSGFKSNLLPHLLAEEDPAPFADGASWSTDDVERRGIELASDGAAVWY